MSAEHELAWDIFESAATATRLRGTAPSCTPLALDQDSADSRLSDGDRPPPHCESHRSLVAAMPVYIARNTKAGCSSLDAALSMRSERTP